MLNASANVPAGYVDRTMENAALRAAILGEVKRLRDMAKREARSRRLSAIARKRAWFNANAHA